MLSCLSPESTSDQFCGTIYGASMLTFLRCFLVVITSLQRAFHYFWQVHIPHEALNAPLNTAALKEQLDKQSISLGLICSVKSVKAFLHDVLTGQVVLGKVLEKTFICFGLCICATLNIYDSFPLVYLLFTDFYNNEISV